MKQAPVLWERITRKRGKGPGRVLLRPLGAGDMCRERFVDEQGRCCLSGYARVLDSGTPDGDGSLRAWDAVNLAIKGTPASFGDNPANSLAKVAALANRVFKKADTNKRKPVR